MSIRQRVSGISARQRIPGPRKRTEAYCNPGGSIYVHPRIKTPRILARGGSALGTARYLPAHSTCNRSRWFYNAEEIQWILSIGVFMRTQIENMTTIGWEAGEKFLLADPNRRNAPLMRNTLCNSRAF